MKRSKLSHVQAVFIDLDGTLLDSSSKIPSEAMQVLQKIAHKGIRIGIATGRPIASIRRLMATATFPYAAITLNGTAIFEDALGALSQTTCLTSTEVANVWTAIDAFGPIENVAFDCVETWYAMRLMGAVLEFTDMYGTPHGALPHGFIPPEPVMNIIIEQTHRRDQLERKIHEVLQNKATTINYHQWPSLEVMPLGCSKGTAIEFLCERWSLSIENVLAFGDGENDYDMLKRVGVGVAMENARPLLRTFAHFIAGSHKELGVSRFLSEHFLS